MHQLPIQKALFYATDKITKALTEKAKNSLYKKDFVFLNICNGLENKNILPEKIPLNTPFVEKKENNIRTALYSFHRPFEALEADIAYISFLARSSVNPKFCLLFVDLFTSKIYIYPMKKKKYFIEKLKLFDKDVEKKGWSK